MKIPEDAIISEDKLRRYLLLPRKENDKSDFLATAGYTLANWGVLKSDLQQLIQTTEAYDTAESPYGTKYEVRGELEGPNGRKLQVVTVWITLVLTGETRFVTLYPERKT